MVNFVPQLFTLNKADLFLTHGGPNSVFEGIYTETPMLVFPLNNTWDQNGAAARVVYHNIGIKANITDSIFKIEAQISTLLTDQSYKESIAEMAKKIKQKYTDGYFSDQLDKIIGFKNGSEKESK
jgi:zeaxanthin glucosyltransferase